MSKPKLLYASPFSPKASGISDYSTVLVRALEEKFDITLFTDDYEISEHKLQKYPVLKYGKDEIDYDRFDYLIYNIGNQPYYHSYIYEAALEHPGLVILHDMVLYYLFVGYYQNKGSLYSSVYNKLGLDDFLMIKEAVKNKGTALLEQKEMASMMEMNRELLMSGNKFMVHSEYTKKNILNTGVIDEKRVKHINMIKQIEGDFTLLDKTTLFNKYHIPKEALLIASFGYIAETKMNKEVARTIKSIAKKINLPIVYLMVGEGGYADNELEPGLVIKTGFTNLDEFNSFVYYSDIIVNLRYPSMGETSASMLRILQLGKTCITNNGGWFSEIPDDCVYKIDIKNAEDSVYKALVELINNLEKRKVISDRAVQYIEENHNDEQIIGQIYDYLVN